MNRYAAITTLILSSLVGTASASISMDCNINDENLAFQGSVGIPHTRPVEALKFSGDLDFKRLDIPKSLRSLVFSEAQSVKPWIDDHSMGFRLHWARKGSEPARMKLLLVWDPTKEDNLGRYTLTLSFTPLHGKTPRVIRVSGNSVCSVG